MPIEPRFLGTGWSFPPAFDREVAQVELTSGVEDIRRSLEILFTTSLGERIMNPRYGCSLSEMVFEPMTTSRVSYLENLIRTAILYHEPRIDADSVSVQPDPPEGRLLIALSFRVRGTNSRFNLVYPFYLDRGAA